MPWLVDSPCQLRQRRVRGARGPRTTRDTARGVGELAHRTDPRNGLVVVVVGEVGGGCELGHPGGGSWLVLPSRLRGACYRELWSLPRDRQLGASSAALAVPLGSSQGPTIDTLILSRTCSSRFR